MNAQERKIRGRIGALVLHAKGETNTGPAREAFLRRFEREVDPNNELPEAERQRRAEFARRAYFQQLALKSARARARRNEGGRTS